MRWEEHATHFEARKKSQIKRSATKGKLRGVMRRGVSSVSEERNADEDGWRSEVLTSLSRGAGIACGERRQSVGGTGGARRDVTIEWRCAMR
eukprot:975394-Rhodomonas_salina.2